MKIIYKSHPQREKKIFQERPHETVEQTSGGVRFDAQKEAQKLLQDPQLHDTNNLQGVLLQYTPDQLTHIEQALLEDRQHNKESIQKLTQALLSVKTKLHTSKENEQYQENISGNPSIHTDILTGKNRDNISKKNLQKRKRSFGEKVQFLINYLFNKSKNPEKSDRFRGGSTESFEPHLEEKTERNEPEQNTALKRSSEKEKNVSKRVYKDVDSEEFTDILERNTDKKVIVKMGTPDSKESNQFDTNINEKYLPDTRSQDMVFITVNPDGNGKDIFADHQIPQSEKGRPQILLFENGQKTKTNVGTPEDLFGWIEQDTPSKTGKTIPETKSNEKKESTKAPKEKSISKTKSDEKERSIKDGIKEIRLNDPEVLKNIDIQQYDFVDLAGWASAEEEIVTPEILDKIADKNDRDLKRLIADNKKTGSGTLSKIFETSDDPQIRQSLAKHQNASPELLDNLSKYQELELDVIKHKNTSTETLEKIAISVESEAQNINKDTVRAFDKEDEERDLAFNEISNRETINTKKTDAILEKENVSAKTIQMMYMIYISRRNLTHYPDIEDKIKTRIEKSNFTTQEKLICTNIPQLEEFKNLSPQERFDQLENNRMLDIFTLNEITPHLEICDFNIQIKIRPITHRQRKIFKRMGLTIKPPEETINELNKFQDPTDEKILNIITNQLKNGIDITTKKLVKVMSLYKDLPFENKKYIIEKIINDPETSDKQFTNTVLNADIQYNKHKDFLTKNNIIEKLQKNAQKDISSVSKLFQFLDQVSAPKSVLSEVLSNMLETKKINILGRGKIMLSYLRVYEKSRKDLTFNDVVQMIEQTNKNTNSSFELSGYIRIFKILSYFKDEEIQYKEIKDIIERSINQVEHPRNNRHTKRNAVEGITKILLKTTLTQKDKTELQKIIVKRRESFVNKKDDLKKIGIEI